MTDEQHPAGRKRRRLARRSGQVVLVLAVGYVFYGQVSTQLEANEATDDAAAARQDVRDVADPVAALCEKDPEVRRRLGVLCDKAEQVTNDVPAAAPRDGQDGRGIATTRIESGRLLVTYTDGAVEDKGPIVGATGQRGAAGAAGRSITGTAITDGALVLSYSDGTTETAGQVVGTAGVDGKDGRGIAGVAINGDFRLVVTYTDGETVDVGPLPSGRDGRGIASVAFDMASCTATTTYTDGAVEQSPMTGCEPEPDTDPSDPAADPPGGLLSGG